MVDRLSMNILILGATGFIGSAVAQNLLARGHAVTGLGRNPELARYRQPGILWVEGDLRNFTNPSSWRPLLDGIEAVVNCAGALQDTIRDDVHAVQEHAMLALFEAALAIPGIQIVQISAPRGLVSSGTAFMETKIAADRALAASGLRHVILRPALVLGRNAHGGSALLRALAAFPRITPLVHPEAMVQSVSLVEVSNAVASAIDGTIADKSDIDLAGPAASLESLVAAHRRWLGLSPVPVISVPSFIGCAMSGCADIAGWFGWRSPLRSTALKIAQGGITATPAKSGRPQEVLPADMLGNPAGAQDLWFARLYLMKPVIILALSAFWIVSGVIPLFDTARAAAGFAGFFNAATAFGLTIATSLADVFLGLLVLFRSHTRKALLGMIALSIAYLAGATIIQPQLWLDPLGPLVKIAPLMLLALVALSIFEER
jgi:uncharacterized protein YbjT (DUF2867 family)